MNERSTNLSHHPNDSSVAPIDIPEEKYPAGRSGGTDLIYTGQSVRHLEAPKIHLPYSGKPYALSHLSPPQVPPFRPFRGVGG